MTMNKKFRELDLQGRLDTLRSNLSLNDEDVSTIRNTLSQMKFEDINRMIENAVGVYPVPLGIATNFVINGKEYYVPMATEEPSVIAAASYAAKISAATGGFKATVGDSIVRGQIQVISVKDIQGVRQRIEANKEKILEQANQNSRTIKAIDIQTRILNDMTFTLGMPMLIVELFVDTKDAMGANAVNSMCELISPEIERLSGGMVILKILSNYVTERIVTCETTLRKEDLGGIRIVERILHGYSFAYSDPHRAVTHNKGIMNGIDAVALATGQDFRALEAAAHAYASRDGQYRSLSTFSKNSKNDLCCKLEIPVAVGTVGGITSVHPMAKIGLKILHVDSARELAMVIASVGLAQNIGALRALSDEGIQSGHMKLHARNIAVAAGATGANIDIVSKIMIEESRISLENAKQILEKVQSDINKY
jgi:hydroxymethylglutaryl-CoA reductase